MTAAEAWEQIEAYAEEGNWTAVGALGDRLQELEDPLGETVSWWGREGHKHYGVSFTDGVTPYWQLWGRFVRPSTSLYFIECIEEIAGVRNLILSFFR